MEFGMGIRSSRMATGGLVGVAIILMCGHCWAIYHKLESSNDDWKMKYDVEVNDAGGDTLTVVFTLVDEGRLKPFYSIELVAFSLRTDSQGGRSYDVKAPFELKPTKDGRRAGQVKVRKEFADRGLIRILTLTVDGKRQTQGAAYYDIPLKKYLNPAPAETSPLATPPTSKVTK
jgi:hypothetical protein